MHPIQLDDILPEIKPSDLGSVEIRHWLEKSICAFRAALFLEGQQCVGWPYRFDAYAGYKVPSHTDITRARLIVRGLGLHKINNASTALGSSRQWSAYDGRYDKLPGD